MRMRTVFGSCVAAILAITAVAAQQQPLGNDQRPRTPAAAGQQQEVTIVGCIEDQAGGSSRATGGAGATTTSEFVLVAADPAGATSTTGRPSATGTSGSTTGRTTAGTRYSLSGIRERELRAGQRVEIIGRTSSAQNRGTTGQGQGIESNRGTDERTQAPGATRDNPNRVPDEPRGNETPTGTRTDTSRQTTTATQRGADMAMLEIVSFKTVPGNCN